ncbi:MAG TPA: hypothetical protein PLO59_08570, partial [Bacteroidia bacterium]|nr:hypothetical protein [Bacteroidia bacterium]
MKKFTKLSLVVITICLMLLGLDLYFNNSSTKPHNGTLALARIDFKGLDSLQAEQVVFYLKKQKAVNNVMCLKPYTSAIYTYDISQHTAAQIAQLFNATSPITGTLFKPTKLQLSQGCPLSANTFTYKLYKYFS